MIHATLAWPIACIYDGFEQRHKDYVERWQLLRMECSSVFMVSIEEDDYSSKDVY